MRTTIGVGLILALAFGAPARALDAQDPTVVANSDVEPWSSEELENLLAPIALYPDPILAQVLIAATYPDQIAAAAAYVRTNGTVGLDAQPWEISVKAVAHYPPVLNLMAEGEDWAVALGQAYATQPQDVMASVQSLRRMANAQGNLVSTEQQKVIVEREVIRIEPAQPRVIYVPTYDPAVIYYRPVYVVRSHPAYWSWGIGYPVGVWLTYDFDWWGHRVYYHGWSAGPRWVVVARPWIVINPIYVAPRHRVVVVNRYITRRSIDVRQLSRYRVVHRNTTFERRGNGGRRDVARGERGDDRREWDRGDDRGNRGRAVGPSDRGRERGRAVGPTGGENGRRVAPVPMRGSSSGRGNVAVPTAARRVLPMSGAPTRTASPSTSRTRSATPPGGSWNPRSSARSTARPASASRVPTPTAARPSSVSRGVSAARPTVARSTPRSVETPSRPPSTSRARPAAPSRSASVPRASTPRASTPRASAPRASAPRSSAPSRASSSPRGASSRSAAASRGSSRSSGGSARSGRGRPE